MYAIIEMKASDKNAVHKTQNHQQNNPALGRALLQEGMFEFTKTGCFSLNRRHEYVSNNGTKSTDSTGADALSHTDTPGPSPARRRDENRSEYGEDAVSFKTDYRACVDDE